MDAHASAGPVDPDRIRDLVDAQPVRAGAGLLGDLERVCAAAARDLGLAGATITLLPSIGAHVVAAASDDVTRRVEELQFDTGEGPTREAARASAPVLVPDLAGEAFGRWPAFVGGAARAGVGAAFALPLHVGASRFGVLTLYRSEAGSLDVPELRNALVYAEVAVEMLVDSTLPEARPSHGGTEHGRSEPGQSGPVAQDLGPAVDLQSHVFQAQGMVMVQLGVPLPEALARMRAHAYAQGLTLAALATGIIEGTTTLAKGDQP